MNVIVSYEINNDSSTYVKTFAKGELASYTVVPLGGAPYTAICMIISDPVFTRGNEIHYISDICYRLLDETGKIFTMSSYWLTRLE